MRRWRVLHVIDTGGSGGAETVFAALAAGLDPDRFESVTVVGSDAWLAARLRAAGLDPEVLPAKGSFRLDYLRRLVQLIRQRRIDLIQSHLFGSNLYCAMAGRITGVPVVACFHGEVDIDPRSRQLGLKLALLRGGTTRVVSVSDRLGELLSRRRWVTPRRQVTIHNGVDTERFRPRRDAVVRGELGVTDNELLIGALGNIRRPKRYDLLLHACARLRASGLRFRLAIAGQGGGQLLGELTNLLGALGLERHVHLLGFRAESERLLNNLDLFVLSSTSEGFSIATVEAMACGLPVLATRSGGPEEIVTDGVDGMLVEAGNAEALAEGLGQLIQDPPLRSRLAARARDTAVRRFSLGAMIGRYEELYGEILGARLLAARRSW